MGIFLFAIRPRAPLSNNYRRFFPPGVKRPGREVDNSPKSSAAIKNSWSYTSTPQYVFMAWCLVKHKGNFSFALPYPTLDALSPLLTWEPPPARI
jgi:hypothetical protein